MAYVEKLSDFFRTIVKYKDKQVITLEEELNIAQNYFLLQQQRFGSAFIIHQSVDKQMLQTWVPPLVLQLLLENVIKHNAVSFETPLTVSIYCEDSRLIFKNNINTKTSLERSTGTGLQNIINRYKIISKQDVKIIKTETMFMVSLPLIKNHVL